MVLVRRFFLVTCAWLTFVATSTTVTAAASTAVADLPLPELVNRLTWGLTPAELARAQKLGAQAYIDAQLRPNLKAPLPPDVQKYIKALSISRQGDLTALRDAFYTVRRAPEGDQKVTAKQEVRQAVKHRTAETGRRAAWYALYSPNQLQDQMTWFWMNHFNVYADKNNIGAVMSEYEARSIRPRAMGKFGDLVKATVRAPAMLLYLDNHHNRVGKINENYARELMELHTLGVQGGYQQKDVQELARILTGLGITYNPKPPTVEPELQAHVVHERAFLFNPQYHDYGTKQFLGQTFSGAGMIEIDKAVELLVRHPATARHISGKLAQYFVSDKPSDALVNAMAKTFQATDGNIAETLRTMFESEDFSASLKTGKFKDPVHYAYSAARLAYADFPSMVRTHQLTSWISRMGQRLYGRGTPDGYPMTQSDWSGSGQMTTRFDLAQQIALQPESFYAAPKADAAMSLPTVPALVEVYKKAGLYDKFSPATRQAIEGAASVQEANLFLLASPEFMVR